MLARHRAHAKLIHAPCVVAAAADSSASRQRCRVSRYHSAIAAATALEAAKAEKVKKARERAAEQPQAEEWRPETVATSHRARLSIDLELLLAASAVG